MVLALVLILVAGALFLIFHDDHDDSYTRSEKKPGRKTGPESVYQKSAEPKRTQASPKTAPASPRPTPVMDPRTIVPKEKEYRPRNLDERFKPAEPDPKYASAPTSTPGKGARATGFAYEEEKVLDYHFLDRIDYDPTLPERTMSSFIAGIQQNCTDRDLGGLVGYVTMDPVTGAMEVHRPDDRLLGYLPMKDRAAFLAFNPSRTVCPFAGHVALSVTGRYYADIRIVLPSTRDFVEESLVGFLG
jgi:hypothetical protein